MVFYVHFAAFSTITGAFCGIIERKNRLNRGHGVRKNRFCEYSFRLDRAANNFLRKCQSNHKGANMQREYTRSPFGKTDALYLILTALATVGAGSLMGLLGGAHNGYAGLVRPAFTPPDAVFPIVWSAMYAMAGASLYLTIAAPESDYRTASLWLNGAGLALNFGWIPVFFLLKAYFAAFLIIAALDAVILAAILVEFKVSRISAALGIPYLAWLIFATVLTVSILVFN